MVEDEEEEALDEDEEEPLVQEALDNSPEGLGSSAVCANTLRTDENAAFCLWASPRARRPSQATARSLATLGRSPPGPDGLHSAPTSVQVLLPVIVPASANTLPSAAAWTPASVSVQTAVLASAKTFPSGQAGGLAAASVCSDTAPVPGAAERSEGTAGSAGDTGRLIDP